MGTHAAPGPDKVGRSVNLAKNNLAENRDAEQSSGALSMSYVPGVFGALPGVQTVLGNPARNFVGNFTQELTACTLIMTTMAVAVNADDKQIFSLVKDKVSDPWDDPSNFSVANGGSGPSELRELWMTKPLSRAKGVCAPAPWGRHSCLPCRYR